MESPEHDSTVISDDERLLADQPVLRPWFIVLFLPTAFIIDSIIRQDPDSVSMENSPYIDVPMNLPHAGRIARRLLTILHGDGQDHTGAALTAAKLVDLLDPYFESEENPPPGTAVRVRNEAAGLGRQFVDQVSLDALGHDRLGQCVRNLFECLELGQEGAAISLRAGEKSDSLQRPR